MHEPKARASCARKVRGGNRFGLWRRSFRGRQQELERRFASENDKIEIQAAKIRQQLWVVRNRLATVLHGPIQASLQVAAIRLASATTLDAKLSKELQQTIDSAFGPPPVQHHEGRSPK